MELEQRVEKGLEFLAFNEPDLLRKVNLEELAMNSHFYCVLGLFYGSYDIGLTDLDLNSDEAVAYGFEIGNEESYELAELTPIWKTKIVEWREKQ